MQQTGIAHPYLDAAREILPEVIALRRRLHRVPEIGLELPRTQALVLDAVRELGLDPVAGVATAAILSNETIRSKISSGLDALRERFNAMRSSGYDELDIDRDDAIAFDAAQTAPIADATPYSEGSALDSTADYPAGLGSNGHEDGIPAFEESTSRS